MRKYTVIFMLQLVASLTTLFVPSSSNAATVSDAIQTSGSSGGLAVCVGIDTLTAQEFNELKTLGNSFSIQLLHSDTKTVEHLKQELNRQNLYGRISTAVLREKHLPYYGGLVNLLVLQQGHGLTKQECMRVLAPNGIVMEASGDSWNKSQKPWPDSIDEWTHYMHGPDNNAVANDHTVGPPKHVQWIANPRWVRSHENDASLSTMVSGKGRLFYIYDEGPIGITDQRLPPKWFLVARDAFNGLFLWKRPMPNWGWRQWKADQVTGKGFINLTQQRQQTPGSVQRRLVTVGNQVYTTLGYQAPVSALDAASGKTLKTYPGTEHASEIIYYKGLLVLTVRVPDKPDSIMVVDIKTGAIRWNTEIGKIKILSMLAHQNSICYNNEEGTGCLSLNTGEKQWHVQTRKAAKAKKSKKKPQKLNLAPMTDTLVAHQGIIFSAQKKNEQGLTAIDMKTGKVLWVASKWKGITNSQQGEDVFIIDDMVWAGMEGIGYDLRTGEIKKKIDYPPLLLNPGHHPRCWRNKATANYIISNKRGSEFLDLHGENHSRNNWARGICRYGILPANGLLYLPPHQCFCYMEAVLRGFYAVAPAHSMPKATQSKWVKGPAFSAPQGNVNKPSDWPTYRANAYRGGTSKASVTHELEESWTIKTEGKPTPPTIVNNRLYVAIPSRHAIKCYDATTGKQVWSFTAGGPVDSPPTLHKGKAYFGCTDGWVYALDAATGQLAWKYRAAPNEARMICRENLESPWPIHGSLLIHNDIIYGTAGRSSFLDGGIHLFGIDATTQKINYSQLLSGPEIDLSVDEDDAYNMDGWLSDILSTDGKQIYMRNAQFDLAFNKQATPDLTDGTQNYGGREMGMHILSTAGMLDDTHFDRTFWMHAKRWPGFYHANDTSKAGQLLVADETTTYSIRSHRKRNIHSTFFFAGTDGVEVFADDNSNEPFMTPKDAKGNKHSNYTRKAPAKWSVMVPVYARSITKSLETVFIAGAPDRYDQNDPLALFEGRTTGVIWAMSAEDGKKLAEFKLPAPPVFDGFALADQGLYLSLSDGSIIHFKKK